MKGPIFRPHGDIQTAVVTLVDRLAPLVALPEQPALARDIAARIAATPSSMADAMFLRQSIIRGGTATRDHVIEGLAAWVTVLFDLGNLRHDRARALDLCAVLPEDAVARLGTALSRSRNGCILAVPHIGSIELFAAHLADRGFTVGFVYTIGETPTPTEQWILEGRRATLGTPIAFGRRTTGAAIAAVLRDNGVVFMVADVYPSARYKGIPVRIHDVGFRYPPGPARYARTGTLVLPGYASRRDTQGISMQILDPIEDPAWMSGPNPAAAFTQDLAVRLSGFIADQPAAYWLWHPIPNDPFVAMAQQLRPGLLRDMTATEADDEVTAQAAAALDAALTAGGGADRLTE